MKLLLYETGGSWPRYARVILLENIRPRDSWGKVRAVLERAIPLIAEILLSCLDN
jgi:hypothetical protein